MREGARRFIFDLFSVFAAFEDPNFAPPNGKLYMQRRKDGK